jgi:hypothetical protein
VFADMEPQNARHNRRRRAPPGIRPMITAGILFVWLAANYALAALLTYGCARRFGLDRRSARLIAAVWPFALIDVVRRDRTARPQALRARGA